MKSLPATFRRVFRLLLIPLILSSALVKGAFGETIVLHRHGMFRTHAHLMASTDALATIVWSTQFGHFSSAAIAFSSLPTPIHVVAIILVAPTLLTVSDDGDHDEQPVAQPGDPGATLFDLLQIVPVAFLSSHPPSFDHKPFAATQLLRNHALLL